MHTAIISMHIKYAPQITCDQCLLRGIALIQIGVLFIPSGRQIVIVRRRDDGHFLVGLNHVLQSMRNLLVQHIEAHGRQCHAGHNVRRAEPQCRGGLFAQSGHQIAETNCR